jgi:hypothetical protein
MLQFLTQDIEFGDAGFDQVQLSCSSRVTALAGSGACHSAATLLPISPRVKPSR